MATRQIHLANALGVDFSRITDTGINGGGLRIYHWLRRYVEYLWSFYHKANLVKTREEEWRLALVDHQGRTPGASTVLPIWVNGSFRPARVRLIRGKTELLSGMHIVKELAVSVLFGSDRFEVGQGEWGVMTFNEKRHWVFPLAPTACAYTKLDEYFGELRKAEIEVLQAQ